jgi:transcriptional regulator with XRE-family HTH domain
MNGRALLAWNLRRLRTEQGLSQKRLADEAGADRAYINEIEAERRSVTVDFLDKLADCLDVSLPEFFRPPTPGEKRPKALPGGRPRGQ